MPKLLPRLNHSPKNQQIVLIWPAYFICICLFLNGTRNETNIHIFWPVLSADILQADAEKRSCKGRQERGNVTGR